MQLTNTHDPIAITYSARANLIFFESDPHKRGPVYYVLQRLGLATYISVSRNSCAFAACL